MKTQEKSRTEDQRQPAQPLPQRTAAKPLAGWQGSVLQIQRTAGNQAAQRLLSPTGLTILAPDHEQEKAAEHNAEAIGAGEKPLINDTAKSSTAKEGTAVGARSPNASTASPAPVPEVSPSSNLGGTDSGTAAARNGKFSAGVNGGEGPPPGINPNSGQPLPPSVRRFFEERFERDLGGVRVYVDEDAARSAAALQANAYTIGSNIVFGRNTYNPGTPQGTKLLAHELTHVLQRHNGPQLIRRQEGTAEVSTTDYGNGLVLQQWPERGLALLTYQGRNWMQFSWTVGAGRRFDDSNFLRNAEAGPGPGLPRLTISINPSFVVRVQVNRDVEQFITDYAGQRVTFDLEFPRNAHVNVTGGSLPEFQGDSPARLVESFTNAPRETTIGGERGELGGPSPSISVGPVGVPNPQPRTVTHRVWTFSSAEEFNHFAQTHPDTNWGGIATPDGQYVAYALTEESLRRMAERVRGDHYDFEPLQEFPGSRMAELWLRGRHLDSLNDLHNLYYREDLLAALGTQSDRPESEVFRIGNSYGRKPLTHAEALARWRQFDGLTASQIRALETEPGRPFHALYARGAADRHFLDYDYFRTRDEVMAEAARIPDLGMIPQDQMNYLLTEADREQEDPRVRAMLTSHPHLAESLQNQVFQKIEEAGQRVAINAINQAVTNLDRLAGSSEEMARWVLHLPDLPEPQRLDALGVIGLQIVQPGGAVPADEVIPFGMGGSSQQPTDLYLVMQHNDRIRAYSRLLGDRRTALQLSLGNPVGNLSIPTITLTSLQDRARGQTQGLRQLLGLLQGGQVKALRVEGPLGEQVRAQVYRDFGFRRLQANTYPHHQETQGLLPDPLAGGAGQFADMTEQLYANRVAHMATTETIVHVLEVAGMILVTVALILIANAAGAAAASALFAAETTAFAVTETVVAGVVFTGLQVGLDWAITGRPPIDPDHPLEGVAGLAGQTAFNIATFGFFRALNTALSAVSRAGVRSFMGLSEAEFSASAGAQRAAGVLRFSATGSAFISIGIAQFRAQNGRWPTAAEAAGIGLESMATLALLEVGGGLARPYMQRIGIWGRAIRLGELRVEIEQHMSRVRGLNADIASLAAAPQTAARDAAGLIGRQRTLLQEQRSIVDRLRSSLRTRGDADVVDREAGRELARIDQELELLRQVQFLRDADIRPVGEPARPEDALEFSFHPGTEEQIRSFYGAENVERQPDGSLRVRQDGRTMIFRPATPQAPGTAATTPQPQPTATTQQQVLASRQREVVARARRLGLGNDPTIQAIERLQPGRVTRPETLRQQDRLIATAERTIGQQAETMGRDALRRHRERLRRSGLSMDNVRTGALANLTDQQVGEILAQIPPGTQGLGESELRGLLFAGQAPPSGSQAERISLSRILDLSRSAAERNFILNSFGRLMEARVPGTYDVLSSMTGNANNWRGGAWMLEYARYLGGRVAAFEVSVSDPQLGERRYDIVLTDGTRVELKDWENWFPDSLQSQFRRDVLLSTNNFANPDAITRVRWVFRTPGPVSAAEIRATMREALNRAMDQANLSATQRQQMIRAFDGHTDLVEISSITRESVPLPPPPVSVPVPMQQQRREGSDQTLPVPTLPVQPQPSTGGQ